MGIGTPDISQSTASSSSLSLVFQVDMLSHFLDQWGSITSNRNGLNMVQGHHLQLRSHPPLFRNFWQLNVTADAVPHAVIQEVDKLLSKGAVEPSSGSAGFYSSVLFVPKHTGGFQPMLKP